MSDGPSPPAGQAGVGFPCSGDSTCDSPLKCHGQDVEVPTDGGAVLEVFDVCGIDGERVLKFPNSYSVTHWEEKGDVCPTRVVN